jgi:hypothetical protein
MVGNRDHSRAEALLRPEFFGVAAIIALAHEDCAREFLQEQQGDFKPAPVRDKLSFAVSTTPVLLRDAIRHLLIANEEAHVQETARNEGKRVFLLALAHYDPVDPDNVTKAKFEHLDSYTKELPRSNRLKTPSIADSYLIYTAEFL